MARIRTIKPEFWTNERVMECSLNARLLFIGMWNFADDLGRLPMSPKTLKAMIFPSDDISADALTGMVQELSRNGLVLLYSVEGRQYLQVKGWQHQRIDKPQPGKYPAPVDGYSENVPGMVATERKGEEGKVEEEDSEPRGSDAVASPGLALDLPTAKPVYTDSKHELWGEGIPVLVSLGVSDRNARSNIGRWLKDTADDAVAVLGAIQRARDNRVIEPVAWITRSLQTDKTNGTQPARHRSRPIAQDALVAGMAAALSERPDSRLYAGPADGWGHRNGPVSGHPTQPGPVAVRALGYSGKDRGS